MKGEHSRIKKIQSGWGGGRGPDIFFLNHQCFSQRAVQASLKKQLDPFGSNCSSRGSVPVFLRNPIVTCDFPGMTRTPVPPLDLPLVIGIVSVKLSISETNYTIDI